MPRIRTIKPEFWADEKLSSLTAIDRLVFLGLIGMADDYGRVHNNLKVIDAFIFPNTEDSSRESLARLSRIGRVRLGIAASGMQILEIVNWSKHQRVDKPQKQGSLPPINEPQHENNENIDENAIRETVASKSRDTRETLAPGSRIMDQGSSTLDQGEGKGFALEKPISKSKHGNNPAFAEVWEMWKRKLAFKNGPMDEWTEALQLKELEQFSTEEAIEVVQFSASRTICNNLITNGDHRKAKTALKQSKPKERDPCEVPIMSQPGHAAGHAEYVKQQEALKGQRVANG
jgi:hypothetical protein